MMADWSGNGFRQFGGYMEAKEAKLQEQYTAASELYRESNLFKGIAIYVNGRTNPSADELKRLMMMHGGIFHHYENSHTTFIIASNLPDVKVRNMDTSNIISAQWVVDCIKASRILDYTNYLLYTNRKISQPRINFTKSINKTNALTIDDTENRACFDIVKELQELQAKIRKESGLHLTTKEKPFNISTTNNNTSTNTARTAIDPNFLTEFFNNSRLHHIATLGTGFKQYVSVLRMEHGNAGFPARQQLKTQLMASRGVAALQQQQQNSNTSTCIMHIDMDCFFVSVGLRKHPELRGQPVAVTHSKGGNSASNVPVHPKADRQAERELFAKRFEQNLHDNIRSDKVRLGFDAKMSLSEIASCSYEAREKGIRNGMFMGQAIKLCPDLKTIPYDFEGYREVANMLYNTVAQYTLNIEAVSCDEMFVELTDVLRELQVDAMSFVSAIREEVRQKTGCPCSAGIGANKLQARMATKRAKPDGQFMLNVEDVAAYMALIAIEELPGIGSSTAYTLNQAKLNTCADLQQMSLPKLQMLLGKKLGETVHQYARGIDNRPLVYDKPPKSVSVEVNYGIRFKHNDETNTFLKQLCVEVHKRLSDIKRKTKCITLKLMVRAKEAPVETSKFMGHGICDNVTKSVSLVDFTNDLEKIQSAVIEIMLALNVPAHELRGIGIQLTKLDKPNECKTKQDNAIMNMFSKVAEKQKEKGKQQEISTAIASVKDKKSDDNASEALSKQSATINNQQRKRGRKSKHSASPPPQNKKQRNMLNMLTNQWATARKSPAPADNTNLKSILNEHINQTAKPNEVYTDAIDPNVLAELPEEIRNEILQARGRQILKLETKNKITFGSCGELNASDFLPSTSKAAAEKRKRKEQKLQAKAEFLAALPPDLRKEVEEQLLMQEQLDAQQRQNESKNSAMSEEIRTVATPVTESITDNMFLRHDMVELLRKWVKTQSVPNNTDIDILSDNACELVRQHELEPLYEGMLYLCRIINSKRGSTEFCAWHVAYNLLVEKIQKQMRAVYKQPLAFGDQLYCNACKL